MEDMAVYRFIAEGNGFAVESDIVLGSSCICLICKQIYNFK